MTRETKTDFRPMRWKRYRQKGGLGGVKPGMREEQNAKAGNPDRRGGPGSGAPDHTRTTTPLYQQLEKLTSTADRVFPLRVKGLAPCRRVGCGWP